MVQNKTTLKKIFFCKNVTFYFKYSFAQFTVNKRNRKILITWMGGGYPVLVSLSIYYNVKIVSDLHIVLQSTDSKYLVPSDI